MAENTYQKLAEHLDKLPGGFSPSETGADIRLLRRLFTPEEAALAVHLTLQRETAAVIAVRASLPVDRVQGLLDGMVQKGLIFGHPTEKGPDLYQAVPMIVGIYELQIKNLDKELVQFFREYWSSAKPRPPVKTIPQMRTIPVGESIENLPEALPYDQVYRLVESHDCFAVTKCICRQSAKMMDDGCNAPLESCMVFGEWADHYVRTGRGRSINRAEMIEILKRADKANLVLQPSNAQEVSFICSCCSCCCGILRGYKRHPRPADAVASAYMVELDSETCEGCWTCLDRCPMDALVEDLSTVILKSERCIGCGLCVTTCPSGSLRLIRKEETQLPQVPETMDVTWETIVQDQARSML